MAGGVASQRRLKIAERRQAALELRKAGASYRDIAKAVKEEYGLESYSPATAYRDVMACLSEIRERTLEHAEHVMTIELARLDDLLSGLWQKAAGGDLLAVDRVLRIMERRAKLLGLDAPTRAVVDTGGPLEVVTRIVRISERDEDGDSGQRCTAEVPAV